VAGNRVISAFGWRLTMLAGCLLAGGCAMRPTVVLPSMRATIDRRITEYPDGFELKPFMTGLNCPMGICWDDSGNLIVAEGGIDGRDPRIIYVKPDRSIGNIYPVGTRIPIVEPGFRIDGPIGGIVACRGKVYVSHRDANDMGVITAFDYNGDHRTVVANLPAQGDFGVTDLAIPPLPAEPRLYFGVGAATNSGVVGLDNWEEGWLRWHRQACDLAYQALSLLGFRFDAANPEASIFSPGSLITVPFEPFGTSDVVEIPGVDFPLQKPSAAIMSVALDGGDLRVEAWGVRDPVGLALNDFGAIYVTDRGMELRGTRPIDNDPDALYQVILPGTWLGWPDYSTSLEPISLPKYQPPRWMVIPTGYPKIGFLIDHDTSHLKAPAPVSDLLRAEFPWQSGVGKMAFIPKSGPFHTSRFEGELLVAMWGDRAPFSTSGRPMPSPLPGYRIVRVDTNGPGRVMDFIYNTQGGPASMLSEGRSEGLERPIDVKFGPDGNLYILDFGQAVYKHGQLQIESGTGKIFVLVPAGKPRSHP
jgi:glucose/arabinose dehydrogenase